jgi:branched-chain amino acid aminotransferase
MRIVTTINGRFIKRGREKISVFDNSLLYAEGLFETSLAVDNRIVFLKEHLERLAGGAKVIGIRVPVSKETLSAWMLKTVGAHPERITKLRLTVTGGLSERWAGVSGPPQVVLIAASHRLPEVPFRLYVSDFRVDEASVFRRIKTISYAINAAALGRARQNKCDDALLFNESGNVAEATSANIFWVRKGRVFTPPLSAGCLDGVTRRILLRRAGQFGIDVAESNASLDDLTTADEIFISSSLKLVIPVSTIKTKGRTWRVKIGPVGQVLTQRFRRLVGID